MMNSYVVRRKLRMGFYYGAFAGLAFSVFAWGVDAFLLALANGSFFWVKFLPGMILCVLSGGVAGWLTMRLDHHLAAGIFWGALAVLFSWLALWMPTTAVPLLIGKIDPSLAKWFDFSPINDLIQFRLINLVIIGSVSIICGLLEINLVQQAMLATHGSSIVTSLLICGVLFGLAGSAVDQIINSNLREPVQVVNSLLQFAAENYGLDVPKDKARMIHLSSARRLGATVKEPRRLLLIKYDADLLIMHTLVNFNGTLADCMTINSQPTDCIFLTPNP